MEAQDIFNNREVIIPVIGENCFFYQAENGDRVPLQSYLIDEIIKKNNVRHPEDLPIDQMKNMGFYGLSLCRQQCGFSGDEDFIKKYRNIIHGAKSRIHMDDTIKEFLEKYKFHLIITTCCFDIIEAELLGYEPRAYIVSGDNKKDINADGYFIYHIFGLCDNGSIWAWDEESLMYILHCIHKNDYESFSLRRYIFPDENSGKKVKSLLILNSNLPDWLFRFFLYPIAHKDKWSTGYYLNRSESDSESDNDNSLKNFIERVICYDIVDSNVDFLLRTAIDIYQSIETDSINRIGHTENRIDHTEKYDIFISYAQEDKKTAIKIKGILEKQYDLNIWMDTEGGIEDGSYTDKIKDGIQNSAYFMPLMTGSYMSKLKNKAYDSNSDMEEILKDDKKASYVQKEAWAASCHWKSMNIKYPRRKTYVLPIIFEDSDPPITYETIQACIGLGQLPENIFKEQTIFTYNSSLFLNKKNWKRYKTIEN